MVHSMLGLRSYGLPGTHSHIARAARAFVTRNEHGHAAVTQSSRSLMRAALPSTARLEARGIASKPASNFHKRRLHVQPLILIFFLAPVLYTSFQEKSGSGWKTFANEATASPVAAGDPAHKLLSMDEVAEHDAIEKGIWVVIAGEAYDVTEFLAKHPGGQQVILQHAGKDVTDIYMPIHPPTAIADGLDASKKLGPVDPATIKVVQHEETEAERRRKEALANLPHVQSVLNLDEFEKIAETILTEQAWAYYRSAGDDEVSYNHNGHAFDRVWFRPRILRKVANVDTASSMLSTTAKENKREPLKTALPVYISPAAMAKLGHPDGELNLTRAAGKMGIVQGISANASVSLDDMLDARVEGQATIYQMYINKDRAISERILRTIQERGVNAVFLTVDAPVMGKRERDMRVKGAAVQTGAGTGTDAAAKGGGVAAAISGYIDADITWDSIAWYRSHCSLPLILKGISTIEDVALAAQHGIDGVVLSNHGGRSLDYAPAPLDVLIELREKRPDLLEKLDVYIDGGIRRGTDVVKALALGAKGVGLGRPFLYAQSGYGERGAVRVIEILHEEIERALRFLGVASVRDLGPEHVEVLPRCACQCTSAGRR